ncbi:MAG: MurR/RpiR family transcriptional regulator [Clostridia bacterium]|nr:MurR/RpiR family transcriptional regulator [Clostridia bacterium]
MAALKSTLLSRLKAHGDSFSKGQRAIAAYITDHCDKAAFMTAAKLGETVGVSESTVVRFATELGLAGYPELQKLMQDTLRSRLTVVERMALSRDRMGEGEVAANVMASDMADVRRTLEELSPEVFDAAVDAIVSARRVYIYGAGSCRALASFLDHYLKLLLPNVHLIFTTSEAEIFEELLYLGKEDAVIGISFPRYSSKAVKTLHFASSRRAKVIALTDSALSPLAEYADHLLLAHSDLPAVVDSLVAPLSLLNALIVAISMRQMGESTEALSQLEDLWETYQMYEPLRENLT